MADEVERLSPDELRELFLFESLDEQQLGWLAANGYVKRWSAGATVYDEGEPATCFFVLLEGTLSMLRSVENTEVETTRTNQRGVYSGATQAFVQGVGPEPYRSSVRSVTDTTFWIVDAAPFGDRIREWFPMAMHMLEGFALGMRSSQALVGQRAAALPRSAVRRAHPRAQQPGGRRRPRHLCPA